MLGKRKRGVGGGEKPGVNEFRGRIMVNKKGAHGDWLSSGPG